MSVWNGRLTTLNWGAGLGQPGAVGRVEMGREAAEDGAVVGVEPGRFLVGEHRADYRRGVDGAERERLEAEETAEAGVAAGHYEKGVLRAHAELRRQVDARLVGYGHALDEGRGLVFHAYLVRAFMHAEVRAYAVARAVQIVEACAPKAAAGYGVDLRARRAAEKAAQLKLDVGFEHEGVDAPLLVGERAEGYGARDVGCAVEILRT